MAEPWPVERFSASCWRVLHDSAHHDSIDFWHEEHARRYAALPVLIAALREACCEGAWCRFCEAEIDEDGSIPHDDDCPGIAALKAARKVKP